MNSLRLRTFCPEGIIVSQSIMPQLDKFTYALTVLFYPIFLYISGNNVVIFFTIILNRNNPLELVIGWQGVSVTPIITSVAHSNSNSTLFAVCASFLTYLFFTLFLLAKISIFNPKRDFVDALATLLYAVLCVYTAGHFALQLCVLLQNSGLGLEGVSFVLGSQDVRLSPTNISRPGS